MKFSVERGMVPPDEFLSRLEDYELVKNNKRIEYYNVPAAFDIETSSFYINGEKRGCAYIWMFGIHNLVTYGRTWDEFKAFIRVLSTVLQLDKNRRLAVYIHNLSYEFQWFRKHFDWDEVFILDERKPAYCRCGGIEYRCSLKLAGGKSLANVGKDLVKYKVDKKVGDLDYSKVRTPLTPLSDKELGYCENDIRVLLSYIQEKIEHDGGIHMIPITNTGYVRNFCRKACYERWKKYRMLMDALHLTPTEYSQLKRAFQGGFTHANAHYAMKLLENVASKDLSSSYPTVMVLEKFPMSRAEHIQRQITDEEFNELLETHCCMFDLEITNLTPKLFQDNPISKSKCQILENCVENNGRVVFATRLKTTVTEQDYKTYLEFYNWEDYSISNLRVFKKQYLPKQFVLAILKMYGDKTSLKGTDDIVNYMISKNMINSAYGMMVTDINRKSFEYHDDIFSTMPGNIEENIEKYNNNVKRFLYYPWGVWVTAYARRNLFKAIKALGEDYVYADTDSVKYFNFEKHEPFFKSYDDDIRHKIQLAADFHRINPNLFSPISSKGKPVTIGLWDFEGIYDKFKTLGAKRYLVEKDGKYTLTVAGVNKESARDYLVDTGDPFGEFQQDLVIPKSHTKRNILTYIDDETEGSVVDYTGRAYHFHELSSVHMEGTEYSFSIADAYVKYLKGIRDISE